MSVSYTHLDVYKRQSDTDYKVDFLTVRTSKNRTDSTVSDGKAVLLDNENTDSGDSTDSTDGSGSTDTTVTDTIVTDAATVQLSFRLLVNSDNAFKVAAAKQVAASWNSLNGVNAVSYTHLDVYKRQSQYLPSSERVYGSGLRDGLH